MYCRCGNQKILAHGLCSTCYTLRRQDDEYFGGLRETVLQRDGYGVTTPHVKKSTFSFRLGGRVRLSYPQLMA
jgi:hypothetical protein